MERIPPSQKQFGYFLILIFSLLGIFIFLGIFLPHAEQVSTWGMIGTLGLLICSVIVKGIRHLVDLRKEQQRHVPWWTPKEIPFGLAFLCLEGVFLLVGIFPILVPPHSSHLLYYGVMAILLFLSIVSVCFTLLGVYVVSNTN